MTTHIDLREMAGIGEAIAGVTLLIATFIILPEKMMNRFNQYRNIKERI